MGKIVTPEANVAMLMTAVEAGFPYHLLSGFSGTTGIPLDVVAATVRIPSRTLSRRKTEGKLQPDESERLLRLSNLVANAVSLFEGDRGAAMDWLRRPQKGLGGGVPLDYAKTEVGARAVEDLIGRLEHGVFT